MANGPTISLRENIVVAGSEQAFLQSEVPQEDSSLLPDETCPAILRCDGHSSAVVDSPEQLHIESAPNIPQDPVGSDDPDLAIRIFDSSDDQNFMPFGAESYQSEWLLGGDFDLDAFNMSIQSIPQLDYQEITPSANSRTIHNGSNTNSDRFQENIAKIQGQWYTRIPEDLTCFASANIPYKDQVDDTYRLSLSFRLQGQNDIISLPSTEFLVCPP